MWKWSSFLRLIIVASQLTVAVSFSWPWSHKEKHDDKDCVTVKFEPRGVFILQWQVKNHDEPACEEPKETHKEFAWSEKSDHFKTVSDGEKKKVKKGRKVVMHALWGSSHDLNIHENGIIKCTGAAHIKFDCQFTKDDKVAE